MATVDDKVVAMSFESSKFESGVNAAISALDKLKKALSFPNAGKGLDDLSTSANKVDLSHIGNAVDSIKGKFSALSVIAITALTNIVNKAVTAGLSFAKSLTIDPIVAGFHNYETQINAVQTILANTGLTGKKGLDQVNSALAELNTYANKTVYNFSEMAKNIGTFTAAGVDLKTSTASIKGIANLAALSGSNADQASSAMYQLSQAIASGTTKLQDWNSVVNAGMGGKVFQKALYDTGVAMHTIKNAKVGETFDQWTASGNSFRQSLHSGWLTSKVLTTTLKGFTGDMTTAQLKAEGYTAAQIKDIEKLGKVATGAATNIKTMTQLQQALKEEVATAWSAIFKTIFGNINQATSLFSKVHVVMENALTGPIYALNKLLEVWSKLGGRAVLIDALKSAFKSFGAVIGTVKAAFRDIFPATTGKQLYDLTVRFDEFVKKLKPSAETLNNLKRTFEGLFAILDIGKQIIGGIFTVFGKLFGVVGKGGSGFLNLTGSIGDFLVSVDQALKKGDRLHNFFVTLGNVLAAPIAFLGKLAHAVGSVFSGFSEKASAGFSNALGGMSNALNPFQRILGAVKVVWDNFINSFSNAGSVLKPAIQGIANLFGSLGNAIANALQNMNFSGILEVIRTGLLGGLFVMLKKFLGGGFAKALGGGIFESVGKSFEALTGSLTAMQQSIKAGAIEKIAISIGILTASIVALSFIDAKKLNTAMSTLTIAFGELIGAMALIDKVAVGGGFLKLPVIASGMILLSAAVGVLTLSVKSLSGLDWQGLAKGLGGVGVLLVGISLASGPLSKNSAGMISAGLGITAIAVAMKILASAVKDFGGLSWAELGKGIASVAASLGAIGIASKLFPAGMIQIGLGLIGVGAGLKLVGSAVSQFGGLDLKTLAKGIGGIAVALLAIAVAMTAMPSGMAVQAAGLILVSLALKGMASAIGSFGGMSIGALAKGIIGLAAALLVLSVALIAMEGSLSGAAALAVAAGGIALLAPALTSLGKQSWGEIVKGMVSLAASMVILGLAGLLLEPVAPVLLALGAAMLGIGGGLALAGAGLALVGIGLSAIAVSGPIAIGVLLKAFTDFIAAIPKLAQGMVQALLAVVTSIANSAPQFVTALGQILVAMANAVIVAMPQIVKAFDALMKAALQVIKDNFPALVKTGFDMLMALLQGIKNNMGQVVNMVVQIVITFLNTLAGRIPSIIAAGVNVLVKLMEGIANSLNKVVDAAVNVVTKFIGAISSQIGRIISAGANIIVKFVEGIGNVIDKVVNSATNVVVKFVNGIGNNFDRVVTAGTNTVIKLVNSIADNSNRMINAGADAIIKFLNGVADTIRSKEGDMMLAGLHIGTAIVEGAINGLSSMATALLNKIGGIFGSAISWAKHILGMKSPSTEFAYIGKMMMDGLVVGIDNNASQVNATIETTANTLIDTMSNTLGKASDTLSALTNMNPVITPVVDLTQVQSAADQMNSIFTAAPVVGSVSYGQAASISSAQAVQGTSDSTVPGTPSIKFEQNNYSPESLSPVEIYRQTKNQLSQVRLALA